MKKAKNLNSKSAIAKKQFFDQGNKLPICVNEGCNNFVTVREWKNWSIKSECTSCISARKRGITREGVKIHKKNYCENFDGHLNFDCPVKEKKTWKDFLESLDLDHIDGDHMNNKPSNVRTYCKLCHNKKSKHTGDWNSNKPSRRKID